MSRADPCPKCGTPGIECCAGCGRAYNEEGAKKLHEKETCNDCPAGSYMRCPNPKCK